jgi:hypothetical protein
MKLVKIPFVILGNIDAFNYQRKFNLNEIQIKQ